MRVDELFKQTITMGKTNKEASELLNVCQLTLNRYKKVIKITSNCKPVNRTTD